MTISHLSYLVLFSASLMSCGPQPTQPISKATTGFNGPTPQEVTQSEFEQESAKRWTSGIPRHDKVELVIFWVDLHTSIGATPSSSTLIRFAERVTERFRIEIETTMQSPSPPRRLTAAGADCIPWYRNVWDGGELGDGICLAKLAGRHGSQWIVFGIVRPTHQGYLVDVQLVNTPHPADHHDMTFVIETDFTLAGAVSEAWRKLAEAKNTPD